MGITLQPVTVENWRALIKLQVREDQTHFVASNLYSIAEAQFGWDEDGHWDFYPFGAYMDNEPVGFAMYAFNFDYTRFEAFIARLMVDEKLQGKGYGREIMKRVLEQLATDERIRNVGISYEPNNESARKLYASLGFVEPGEIFDGEVLAILNLR